MPTREERIKNLKKVNDESHKLVIQSLQTALYKLLKKNSLNNITVTQLVKEAGVSRGVFYKYFYNITDVLLDDIKEISLKVSKRNESSSNLYDNWINILSVAFENKDKIMIMIKAGIEGELLKKLNEISYNDNKMINYKYIIWNGIIFNAIINWAKSDFTESIESYAKDFTEITTPLFNEYKF